MTLLVNEIFHSIQGESLSAGRPCVFVRLTGCNLRCTYCDTAYAYDEGSAFSIGEIVSRVKSFSCPLVEITGGEPLLQDETSELIRRLIASGYEMLIETNGSLDISQLHPECTRIMDIKCPSSGMSSKNRMENLSQLTDRDQLKFVIGDASDYDFAKNILSALPTGFPQDHVLFSPVFGILPPAALSDWILRDRLSVRFHPQLHKIIWPDEERGR